MRNLLELGHRLTVITTMTNARTHDHTLVQSTMRYRCKLDCSFIGQGYFL